MTAALYRVFPRIRRDVTRDAAGEVLRRALTPDEFARSYGVLGHYHIQTNMSNPDSAFRWERVLPH